MDPVAPEGEAGDAMTALETGCAARPHPSETVSGDRHVVAPFPGGVLLGVVDGLGHGPEAARAAQIATEILRRFAGQSVISLMRMCHEALVETRGVALTIASFSVLEPTMTWLGVGNVAARLLHSGLRGEPTRRDALLRGGVVGYRLPQLRASVVPFSAGDLLLFATDGVDADFDHGVTLSDSAQRVAESILARHAKGTDDALVLAARHRGRPS